MRRLVLALVAALAAGCAADLGVDSSGNPDPGPGPGPSPEPELVAEIDAIRTQAGLPALAAATFDSAGLREIVVTGVRANGSPEAAEAGDRWHIGSCTKAMTATLIATFVDDGAIDWSTTLEDAFPGMAIDPAYRAVRIEQLLGHRGGVPEALPGDLIDFLYDGNAPITQRRDITAGFLGRAPAYAPGSRFEYSNGGYVIAGAALEALTGQSWETLITDRLFAPLGMDSCHFGAPGTAGTIDQPRGHEPTGEAIEPGPYADNPPAFGPAGTVHCSLADWGTFASEHLRGESGASALASAAAFDKMHTSLGDDYAMGWGVYDDGYGGRLLQHDGSNTVWYASAWVEPGADRAWLATSNIATQATAGAVHDAVNVLYLRDTGR